MVESEPLAMAASDELPDPLREKLACYWIIRGLWAPLMFSAGDVSSCLLDLQIPLQDRLLHGSGRWVDVARQLGRDRGTLHKNREDGAQLYHGPPSPAARARAVLSMMWSGPGEGVPLDAYIAARGDALEWPCPGEENARGLILAELERWSDEGRVVLKGDTIFPGPAPLVCGSGGEEAMAGVFEALQGLTSTLAGVARGEQPFSHLSAFFAGEDTRLIGAGLGQMWQELGIPLRAPWEVPASSQGEYVLWNLRYLSGPVDEDLILTPQLARTWLRMIQTATAPLMARGLGHVDLLLDGARRIIFEEALEAHGEGWSRYASDWGVSRAAMARWGDYPSLLEGAEPQNTFAAERKARMVEAHRFLASRMPEYVPLIKIHEHIQKARGRIYPLPETTEFMRTLALLGYVGRSLGPTRAEMYRGFQTRVEDARNQAHRSSQVMHCLRRLPLIFESIRREGEGSGKWGWTVAVPRRLLPDLAERLRWKVETLYRNHQQSWDNLRPLEAYERGARPTEGVILSWTAGFPRGRDV